MAPSCLCNTNNISDGCDYSTESLSTPDRTKFVYDSPDEFLVEPYLSGIRKLYDDEKGTLCGRFTEFPWSHILIPRNPIIQRCPKPKPSMDEVKESEFSISTEVLSKPDSECLCSCCDTASTSMGKVEEETCSCVENKSSVLNHASSVLEILKNKSLSSATPTLIASSVCNNCSVRTLDAKTFEEDHRYVGDVTVQEKVDTSTSYENKYMGVDVNVGTSREDVTLKDCDCERLPATKGNSMDTSRLVNRLSFLL